MKFKFEQTKQDYENAYFELFKNRLNYQLIIFLGFSAFATYVGYSENYNLINYIVSYFALLIIILLIGVIPDYKNYKKALKIINSKPEFFGLKFLELTLTETSLISSYENKSTINYTWESIKRIKTTNNYVFIILKNRSVISFKKDKIEIVSKLKEYKKNFSK